MNYNDNWFNGVNTHDDVEAAIKAKIQQIEAAIASGDTSLTELAGQVSQLRGIVNSLPDWAKSQNKPDYNVSDIRYDNNTLLSQKLDAMDIAIAAASGGEPIDLSDYIKEEDADEKYVSQTGYVATDNNYTTNEKNKLAGIASGAEVNVNADWNASSGDAQILNKPALAPVATSGSYDDLSDKPTIPDTSGMLTQSDFSVETQGDGNVDINVGTDTYSINLNHTHENMAKIVKVASEPATMDNDTIYVKVDNLTSPTEIESLYLFGLEFSGGIPDTGLPQVTKPINGSVINLGGPSGSVSEVVKVKGRNLTSDLTVTVDTGLTVTYNGTTASSVTIPKADAILGADVTVAYAGTADLDDGELVIYHGNDMLASCTVVSSWGYNTNGLVFHLDGADATTSQWVDRKGGIAFSMNNVTLDGSGGVVFNGTNSYGRYAAADSLGFSADTHTIEVVANIGGTIIGCIFMQNAENKLAFGITSSNKLISTASTAITNQTIQRGVSGFQRGLHTVSFANNTAYADKNALTVETTGVFVSSGSNLGVFIGSRDSGNAFFTGTIYQIRIYNRLLTSAEILYNQQLDIDRYNIS